MKLSGKKIRHKLQVSADPGILFLGLVSSEPDYKVSLLLNKAINANFRSEGPYVSGSGINSECSFSRFSAKFDLNDLKFDLISNRSESCIIDKKLAGIDYLFIVRGMEDPLAKEEMISNIRDLGAITAIFNLEKSTFLAENIIHQIY